MGTMGKMVRRSALLVMCLALGAVMAVDSGAKPTPRCFGAASRDPLHPCHNPALDRSFVPSLGDALLQPSAACRPVPGKRPEVCTFGAPARGARRSVALIGDSHAVHWRAALSRIAASRRWHAYQLYASQCPYSTTPALISGIRGPACVRWRRDVVAWVRRHPSVDTVVVSEHRVPVRVAKGQSQLVTEVAGYIRAWKALAPSVKRIVVIRDTPHELLGTPHCLGRALARHARPGFACRIRRSLSQHVDPAIQAARVLNSPRVRTVDLTQFFCGARYCAPVIGGVLVHKDHGHMTRTYSETLAPYLDQVLQPLMPAPARQPASARSAGVFEQMFGAWATFA
jgi:hypothetical protein